MEKTINTSLNNMPNIAPVITESTTLGELISILNLGAKPQETPTPKKLRETAGEPVAMEDRIKVYRNGFAVYDNGSGRTVVWLPDCRNFTYIFVQPKESEVGIVPEKVTLQNGFLEEQPWAIPVTLIGDHRVEANLMNRKGSRTGTTDFDFDDKGDKNGDAERAKDQSYRKEYAWKGSRFGENPEEAYIRKETQQEILNSLTVKQREVFTLFYKYGYTQQAIADLSGISQVAVKKLLDKSLAKAKKIYSRGL